MNASGSNGYAANSSGVADGDWVHVWFARGDNNKAKIWLNNGPVVESVTAVSSLGLLGQLALFESRDTDQNRHFTGRSGRMRFFWDEPTDALRARVLQEEIAYLRDAGEVFTP